jgi:hypothetical protein
MKFIKENIPSKIKKLRQWVAWKSKIVVENDREVKKKPPIDPKTGKYASVTDPSTWGTFKEAEDRCQKDNLDGVGFVFTPDDPYGGIDLDNCRAPQSKKIEPWANKIIEEANSYTEISPSGKGVKIFLKGKLPGGGRHQGNIEMYDRTHYFTLTGRHLGGTPSFIKDRPKTIVKLYNESFLLEESVKADRPTRATELTDAEIIERAKAAENGEKFSRLWSGEWKKDYLSPSHGDQALAALLAFWTRNPQRLDTLMRQSGLLKSQKRIKKWEEIHDPQNNRTYGQKTIDKALAMVKVGFGQDPSISIIKKLEDYFQSVQQDPKTAVAKVLADQDILEQLCFLKSHDLAHYERFLMQLSLAGVPVRNIDALKRAIKDQKKGGQPGSNKKELELLKKYLPDSPLSDEVSIPQGWFINEEGLFKTNDDGPPIQVARKPVLIIRKLKNIGDGSQDIQLSWRKGGKWTSRIVDRVEIADARRIVNLADYGFPVTSATSRSIVEFLSAFEATNDQLIPAALTTHQMGWVGKDGKYGFLCGRHLITGNSQNSTKTKVIFRGADSGASQIAAAFEKEGTFREWKKVIELIEDYPLITPAVYAALAPPLIPILGAQNSIIDWAGPTSTGKTTALQIGASCWGNPNLKAEDGVIKSWDATATWLDRATAVYKNLPVILDDTQRAKDPDLITKFIYLFSSGQGRGRGTISGLENILSWETIALSSGESKITDLARGGGSNARVLSLWGIPFKKKGIASANRIEEIKTIILSNYGHAGPRFVEYLINERKKWNKWGQDYSELIRQYQANAGQNEVALRQADYIALLHMSAFLAAKALEIRIDYANHLDRIFQMTLAASSRADKAKEAFEVVMSWASSRKESFWRSGGSEKAQPSDGWLGVWNPDGKKDFIAFMPHHLRDFLKAKGYEPHAIIQTWGDKKWILRDRKDLARKVMLDGERVRCYFLKKEISSPPKTVRRIRQG